MICKAGSVTHGKALAEYAQDKTIEQQHVSTEIGRNGVYGIDAAEVIKEMAEHRRQSGHNLKRGYLRLEICPSKEQQELLRDERTRTSTLQKIIKAMGFDVTQWIAWLHERTDHDKELAHVHVLANRVGMDGSVIKDGMIGLKAKAVAEQFDRSMGQRTAAELSEDRRQWLKDEARTVLAELDSYDWDEFKELCEEHGIVLTANFSEKTGKRQGYYIQAKDSERRYKVSEIDRGLTDAHIEKTHKQLRAAYEREQQQQRPRGIHF